MHSLQFKTKSRRNLKGDEFILKKKMILILEMLIKMNGHRTRSRNSYFKFAKLEGLTYLCIVNHTVIYSWEILNLFLISLGDSDP